MVSALLDFGVPPLCHPRVTPLCHPRATLVPTPRAYSPCFSSHLKVSRWIATPAHTGARALDALRALPEWPQTACWPFNRTVRMPTSPQPPAQTRASRGGSGGGSSGGGDGGGGGGSSGGLHVAVVVEYTAHCRLGGHIGAQATEALWPERGHGAHGREGHHEAGLLSWLRTSTSTPGPHHTGLL